MTRGIHGARMVSAKVTAAQVKELRGATGAPMMECKAALSDADVAGDFDRAVEWLRKKGVAAAGKRAGKDAREGLVGIAVADDGAATGVIVEVNSETDFVARNEMFQDAVRTVCQSVMAGGGGGSAAAGAPGDVARLGADAAAALPGVADALTARRLLAYAAAGPSTEMQV